MRSGLARAHDIQWLYITTPEYLKDPEEVWMNEYSATLLAETSLSSEELRFINDEKREKKR